MREKNKSWSGGYRAPGYAGISFPRGLQPRATNKGLLTESYCVLLITIREVLLVYDFQAPNNLLNTMISPV
jgi:hypothetical protein